ncbi:MAG: hypothetical protein NVS4B12_20100 [Ktedonobacteraceae bacterium]
MLSHVLLLPAISLDSVERKEKILLRRDTNYANTYATTDCKCSSKLKKYDVQASPIHATIHAMNELIQKIERLQRRIQKTMVRL